MATTIDHLAAGRKITVIQDFTDARGRTHRVGETGLILEISTDWPAQEIYVDWERSGQTERLTFGLATRTGPGNGRMRQYFAVEDPRPPIPVEAPGVFPVPPDAHVGQEFDEEIGRTVLPDEPLIESPAVLARRAAEAAAQQARYAQAPMIDGTARPPSPETCLGERSVACSCDPALIRPLYPASDLCVRACLRCGTVTASECRGDEGRYTGEASWAYFVARVSGDVLSWLAEWPRACIDHGGSPNRWPMAAELVRYPTWLIPAELRCRDVAELSRIEDQLKTEQTGRALAGRLQSMWRPKQAPPRGLPAELTGYQDLWEVLRLRPSADLARLLCYAHLKNPASPVAVALLWQRADAFDVLGRALSNPRTHEWSAGIAMARDAQPGDARVASALLGALERLSLERSVDVPTRIQDCRRFEEVLVALADARVNSPEVLSALSTWQHRLVRRDLDSVKVIQVVTRELQAAAQRGSSGS